VRYMSWSEGKRLFYSYTHALLTRAVCLGAPSTRRGAPPRAPPRRQQPSSAWPRRWRSSARSLTSRCSSCYQRSSAAVLHSPGFILQSVDASDDS